MDLLERFFTDPSSLVTPPDVYLRVREVLDDSSRGLADLAAVVELDPGLTTRFLRIANSAAYGGSQEIQTVARAVTMLGADLVHDIVLGAAVTASFAGSKAGGLDCAAFWRRAVTRGVYARAIARETREPDPDRYFVLGLLAEIGHMVMYQRLPDRMMRVDDAVAETGLPHYHWEQQSLGFDYCHAGAFMLGEWDLPDAMVCSIQFHQSPAQAEAFERETDILHFAARTEAAGGDTAPVIDLVAMERLNLDADFGANLQENARTETAAALKSFAALVAG